MLAPHLHQHLLDLLFHTNPDTQQQGIDLTRSLDEAEREAIIADILATKMPRTWQLAACCLLERTEALRRTRLFAARCALRRLEKLRAEGREPDELAWQFQETAEALAAGTLTEAAITGIRAESREYTMPDWDWDYSPWIASMNPWIGDDLFRFEDVPEGWMPGMPECAGVTEADLLRVDPFCLDWSTDIDAEWAGFRAAALAVSAWVFGHRVNDESDTIAQPLDRREEAWQRAVWEVIVREGRDPIEMVWQ